MSSEPVHPKNPTQALMGSMTEVSISSPAHTSASSQRMSTAPPSSHTSREFRRLIEAFHDGVLVATSEGIAYANRALLELLNYSQLSELVRHTPQELLCIHLGQQDRPGILRRLVGVLRGRRSHELLERKLLGTSGDEVDTQLYFDSIEFEGLPAVMITVRDTTESRSIQEKLNRAERMASIGTLAAGVAHEINNPLAYVTTNVAYCVERIRYIEELLEGKMISLDSPASLRAMLTPMAQALTEAHQGTSRVATIVRDLRALTREDQDQETAVDLPSALSSALHMGESEMRFRSRLLTDIDSAGAVRGNETRIVQVFLNLIINAAQSFETEDIETNLVQVRAKVEDSKCLVEIEDNGRGIPKENLGRIFDPFFTTKPVGVGTGLGLSICHGLIESMEGHISVRSEEGKGTTFRVELNTASSETPASVRKGPSLRPDIRARVLIVDDEPLILRSVARLLRDQHDIETASNGREGLNKILEDGPYDLVVCDLMMPEMTGMDLHQAVEANDPETAARFIFLTGGAYTEDAKRFLAGVENPKLDKPVQPNLLRSVVSGVLRG